MDLITEFVTLFLCLPILPITADLDLYALPDEHIQEGMALQLTCVARPDQSGHNLADDSKPGVATATSATPKCHFRWNRSYYPASKVSEVKHIPHTGSELYYYTGRDASGQATESTVTITHMSAHYEGVYTCFRECPGRLESASIKLQLTKSGGLFTDKGAIIASIVSFLVIGVVLLVIGLKAFKDTCCCKRSQHSHSSSVQNLLPGELESGGEYSDPPPRYSVVVLASNGQGVRGKGSGHLTSGNGAERHLAGKVADKLGKSASVESVVLLQPPDYEQAIKDLAVKGIYFDTADLSPMPPAYNDMPFIVETAQDEVLLSPLDVPSGASGNSSCPEDICRSSVLRMTSVDLGDPCESPGKV